SDARAPGQEDSRQASQSLRPIVHTLIPTHANVIFWIGSIDYASRIAVIGNASLNSDRSEYRTDTGVIGHLQLREHRNLHGCRVNSGEKNIVSRLEIRRDARLVIGERIATVIVIAGDRRGDADVEFGCGVCS